jgi:hypothetical protein
MSVNAVPTLTAPAASTCTIAPICATPCVSRTTPETVAVEAAKHAPGASHSISAPSLTSFPIRIQQRCTVGITLCVDGILQKRRPGKVRPVSAFRACNRSSQSHPRDRLA